ncbi:hypothetical protein P7K49_016364 [Saguinus oedipus]|uniref:Uncharacterized protein n=1 Tax=Saguinus oedipus TaxID=9490 RepID=A0ABQ9VBX1_SAGOE|nr:hypothetical protein P7K49_016364 [Saguinus oedipus]
MHDAAVLASRAGSSAQSWILESRLKPLQPPGWRLAGLHGVARHLRLSPSWGGGNV